MIGRRSAIALIGLLALAPASTAFASSPPKPFDKQAFEASLTAGGPVVVHVAAPWCVICKAQKPIMRQLRDDPRFTGFEAYEVDFDNDKDSVRAVNARLQSTVIVYNHGKEIARTVGDREEGWIEELFEKAVAAR